MPLALVAPLLAACPSPCEPPLGDPAAPPELVPAAQLSTGALVPLSGQAPEIDLVRPIQGGHVIFAGAFVRNVARCGGGSLRGELRRESGGQPGGLLYFDERTVFLAPVQPGEPAPAGAGWGRPPLSIADVANVPACPNQLDTEILDVPIWLRMTYTGPDGKAISASQRVMPRCRQDEPGSMALCRCECEARYTIEKCQSRDGGL